VWVGARTGSPEGRCVGDCVGRAVGAAEVDRRPVDRSAQVPTKLARLFSRGASFEYEYARAASGAVDDKTFVKRVAAGFSRAGAAGNVKHLLLPPQNPSPLSPSFARVSTSGTGRGTSAGCRAPSSICGSRIVGLVVSALLGSSPPHPSPPPRNGRAASAATGNFTAVESTRNPHGSRAHRTTAMAATNAASLKAGAMFTAKCRVGAGCSLQDSGQLEFLAFCHCKKVFFIGGVRRAASSSVLCVA